MPLWNILGQPALDPDTSFSEIGFDMLCPDLCCSENGPIEWTDFCEAIRKRLVRRATVFRHDSQNVYFHLLSLSSPLQGLSLAHRVFLVYIFKKIPQTKKKPSIVVIL